MGNRTSKTDAGGGMGGSEAYSYNAANMLLSRAGNPYLSDANGNILQGGGRTNTWDSQNRLVSCAYTNAAGVTTTSQFTYACDGMRHRSVTNGQVPTDFVLENSMFIREMSGGSVKATYFMGASGPAYRRDDTTGQVRWYLYDGLGSVLGEVDPQGNITARRKYDVYGLSRSVTGTPTSKHAFVGSLGHDSEDETGLMFMQHRYYDPQSGRFISQDPAAHGENWYVYCGNNPIGRVDSNGRTWQTVFIDALIFILQKCGIDIPDGINGGDILDFITNLKNYLIAVRAEGNMRIQEAADEYAIAKVDQFEALEADAQVRMRDGLTEKILATVSMQELDQWIAILGWGEKLLGG